MITILFLGLIIALVSMTVINFYGIYLCFKKKWYIGVISLLVPFFATIVAAAKLVFKKDLLEL